MSDDIFVEVKSIEEQADGLVAQARAQARKTVEAARKEVAALEEGSKRRLEEESSQMTDASEREVDRRKLQLQDDFRKRRAALEEIASTRVDELANWVVEQSLKD